MLKIKNWKYKHTTFLVLTFVIFFYLADLGFLREVVDRFGNNGYIGIVFTGIFFVSIFTVVPATLILILLAHRFNPLAVALLAGLGAVIGDYLIFHFLKDTVFTELKPFFNKIFKKSFRNKFHEKRFSWLLPILGAIIVASPFPDEIGLGLMGLSKIKTWQFIPLAFILNFGGILALVLLGQSL